MVRYKKAKLILRYHVTRQFRAPSPAKAAPSWRWRGVVPARPGCRTSFPMRSRWAHGGVCVWATALNWNGSGSCWSRWRADVNLASGGSCLRPYAADGHAPQL
jgi:hypothetical protein